jgi:hypothetical protein
VTAEDSDLYDEIWMNLIFDLKSASMDSIVIRPHAHSDLYSIISPLFYVEPRIRLPTAPSDPVGFIVWWDAEDILLLACKLYAWNSYQFNRRDQDDKQTYSWNEIVAIYFDPSVCAQSGASFAMGPYTPNEILSILKDEYGYGSRDG